MNPLLLAVAVLLIAIPAVASAASCEDPSRGSKTDRGLACAQLDPITIFGSAQTARDVAGGASAITAEDLDEFETTDVVRALRRVPGVALQVEDGWALRPNISIRGTAAERSSRVTLMEDNVLIAPAPYAAPAAYYFPTFGRIHSVEVLKGPSSITQGPSTIGGAINLRSTPVPAEDSGFLQGEYGSDTTWRIHGWYGGGGERSRFLAETHQWQSDGYQSIDRSDAGTGFQKEDYLAKLSFTSDPAAAVYQQLEVRLHYAEEDSQQTYLGLADADFHADELRRYGASLLDEMQNQHDQLTLAWRLETQDGMGLTLTAYDNDTERAWYKTEALDVDGSEDPQSFRGTGWANVVAAVNRGMDLGGIAANGLLAILDGADTAEGSIQVRNNARDYYSRGLQAVFDTTLQSGAALHALQAGLRYHEDQEDRLQRNDNYQQLNGTLLLNARGLEGNAGNELQDASAWAAYLYDRIEWADWTLTPGLRYENIELNRQRWRTNSADPSSREPDNFRDSRENDVDVWLPGLGALYQLGAGTRIVAGVHKGFAAPSNEPGVDPEESVNYELGLRQDSANLSLEAMAFFNDYENLVGLCTNSSGSNCEPGEAFNGEGVHVPGLEFALGTSFDAGAGWQMPLNVVYTWMDAEFQTDFVSEFFGAVSKGDPVPYVPENQLWVSLGLERGPWSFFLSGNHLGSVCTEASCGDFEETESAILFDLSAHYRISDALEFYGVIENLTDELYVASRDPYGVRPNKPQTFMLGAKFGF
ncbi:MAG: TonB-dependent receptor [Lysobacterales bacterium]|nr:MAG: TonB-dependent receptor [Xanthomonadales bacterium]